MLIISYIISTRESILEKMGTIVLLLVQLLYAPRGIFWLVFSNLTSNES